MDGTQSTLIGRDAELRSLVEAIDGDRVVVVTGEAGIGKTSLVRAAAAAARREVHEGGGFRTLDWMPYLALRRATGVGLRGDASSVARQVERLVGPDLLFVDDLQWVDEESLAAVELLIGRILVVAAIRTGDPGSERVLALATRAAALDLRLGGLDDDSATELVRRSRPDLAQGLIAGIVDRAAGNPLLLEELAIQGEPSAVLGRALSSRVDLLGPSARRAVELLAVAGCPLPRNVVGRGLEESIRAGIVRPRGSDVEIRHTLVGVAIVERLGPEVLRKLHARLAELLPSPLERARHLAAAGQAAEAARVALAGIDQVAEPRDRAALALIAAETGPVDAALTRRLAAARLLDEVSEWTSVVRAIGETGDAGSSEALVERDAILAHADYALGDPVACRTRLDAANARLVAPQSAAAVRRAVETATYLVNVEGRVEEAIASIDAVRPAQAAGSRAAADLDSLRTSILLLATGAGDPSAVSAALDAAFAQGRYRTATDRARVLQYLLLMGAGSEQALEFLLAQRARFESAGVAAVALEFLADAVLAAVLAGRPRLALRFADELLEQPAPHRVRQTAEINRGRALVLLGRFELAADALGSVAIWVSPDYLGRGELLEAQCDLAYWSGRTRTAIALADAALAIPPPIPVAHVEPLLTRAWASAELGQRSAARLDMTLPRSLAGAPHELEGLAAWQEGDPAGATAAFDRAAEAWATHLVPRALLCRWAAAESRRRAGELERAVAELRSTLGAATAAEFEPLAARVRRSLRLAGVRVSAGRGGAKADGTPDDGLTARERELVALVQRGSTNVEIARRLGLGRPTVARILGSAMMKLGVSSRAQLAASVPA